MSVDEYIALRDFTGASEEKYYYHADTLGSIRSLTDAAQAIVESYDFDEYGRSAASAVGNPYFYTGRRVDTESAFYYYRHRMYSPEHMRFLSRDPIGYSGGMNLYGYVGGNPIRYIDPLGLDAYIVRSPVGKTPRGKNWGHQMIIFQNPHKGTWHYAHVIPPEEAPIPQRGIVYMFPFDADTLEYINFEVDRAWWVAMTPEEDLNLYEWIKETFEDQDFLYWFPLAQCRTFTEDAISAAIWPRGMYIPRKDGGYKDPYIELTPKKFWNLMKELIGKPMPSLFGR